MAFSLTQLKNGLGGANSKTISRNLVISVSVKNDQDLREITLTLLGD